MEAGIDLNVEGFYRKHPRGRIGLEETLAEVFGVEVENVLVTASSSEAIYLAHRVLLQEADEVVVPLPNYPAQLKVPHVVRASLRTLELSFDEQWELQVERIGARMSSRTRLISVTNSHNPTGMQLPQRTLKGLLELAQDSHAWLLSDEAFREFGFESAPPPAVNLGERGISLGTMSKFYGAEDIRIGWVLAEPDVIERLRQLKTWITSVNSRFGEYVAKQILENHKSFVERARRFRQENLELMRRFMENCRILKWVEPNASLLCFPKITNGASSMEFCKRLVEEYGILLDPGSHFGRDGYVRLCFTQNPAKVRKGLEALEEALNSTLRSG